MADDLIGLDFTVNEDTLEIFGNRFADAKKSQIRRGLESIKREWQSELVRQQASLQSVWTPLKRTPKGRSYYERKRHEYFGAKGKGGAVRFLSILKRTGHMMDGYVSGIIVDNNALTVTIPYPNIAARVHQEGPLPSGVLALRPFDTTKFIDKAINIIDDAIDGNL
jgi:hypothetical protein